MLILAQRPVVFVYNPAFQTCDTVTMWKDALDMLVNEDWPRPFVFLIDGSYAENCSASPADFAFHHYGTQGVYKEAWVDGKLQTATIRPGFWRCKDAAPGQVRDIYAWNNAINTMNAAPVRWFQLIVSFNEWIEQTSIEPSTDWRIHPITPPIDPDDPPVDSKFGRDMGIYLQSLALRPPQ